MKPVLTIALVVALIVGSMAYAAKVGIARAQEPTELRVIQIVPGESITVSPGQVQGFSCAQGAAENGPVCFVLMK